MFTIYEARKIITMNENRPVATHVAVKDGHILGVGTLEELAGWGEHSLDKTFQGKVLMPGLVEGHSHITEGAQWRFIYVGYYDRLDPNGKLWTGLKSAKAVLERLKTEEAKLEDPAQPLTAWAYDGIFLKDSITRKDLDAISTTRPIGVLHISGHVVYVNSKALELAGMLRKDIDHPGIAMDDEGLPAGEIKGLDVAVPLNVHIGLNRLEMVASEKGLRDFSRLCVRHGVTTAGDFANPLPKPAVDMLVRVTAEDSFPARIVSLRIARDITPTEIIERVTELKTLSTDRLRFGKVKIVTDGAISAYSARMKWPGYFNGEPNGLWYMAPERLREFFERALEAGVQVHCHTNGDEATDLALDMFELALRKHPIPDHRFTLHHCQLANTAQFKRMKALGLCVNLFTNHVHYWGDQHYEITVGPERAERMNATASALAAGVPMAIHSDAPVTPIKPLFTAWVAVNRLTESGRVLGEAQRISVQEALHAITLGAAYTFGMDDEIGSIEAGKFADFAVLEDDPTEIDPLKLKDVRVWGTVLKGRVFPAAAV